MRTLTNGVEIPENDDWIWEAYGDTCTVHPWRLAVCLHEEPPKSLNPNWQVEPWTRFPLCQSCHEKVHDMSREDALEWLTVQRDLSHPHVERYLKNRKPLHV